MMQSPPTNVDAQLEWLIARASIVDVMTEYTRCVDALDTDGLASLLADDGLIEQPFESFGRDAVAEAVPRHLGGFGALQHQFHNPLIEVVGDNASLRCTFEAVCVRGEPGDMGGADHQSVGGVYDVTLRREHGAWKLVRVQTTFLWNSGLALDSGQLTLGS